MGTTYDPVDRAAVPAVLPACGPDVAQPLALLIPYGPQPVPDLEVRQLPGGSLCAFSVGKRHQMGPFPEIGRKQPLQLLPGVSEISPPLHRRSVGTSLPHVVLLAVWSGTEGLSRSVM